MSRRAVQFLRRIQEFSGTGETARLEPTFGENRDQAHGLGRSR
jgi:hypothetical protein